ncbi:MAG: hypothetical protein IPP71_07615 [Bacteroidetes bacterium]|nr:hypothetical protein [Bacteroidota bacterium]
MGNSIPNTSKFNILKGIIGFFVLLLFTGLQLHAQDTLYHANKGKLLVKILEVSNAEVKYKLSVNPDGPVYVIKRKDAEKIVYATGEVAAFNITQETQKLPKKKLPHQNFVYFHLSDLLLGQLSISYEHTLLNNHLGIRLPVSVGIIELGQMKYFEYNSRNVFLGIGEYGYYNKNKIFSAGIDLFCYPFEWGYANYFVGPSLGYGMVNYQTEYYNSNPTVPLAYNQVQVDYYGWLIKNGVLFVPNKHLCISLSLAMGIYTTSRLYYNIYNPNDVQYSPISTRAVEAGLSVGYKF